MTSQSSFEPGDVVMLKSGGQPITVIGVTEEGIQCVWIGEEGDLFSATLPAIALQYIDDDPLFDDEESHEEEAHEVESPDISGHDEPAHAGEKSEHAA